MSWLECLCARASGSIRVMPTGTAGYADTWMLQDAFAAARLIDRDLPVVLDLRRVDHICPAAYWELERLLTALARQGIRTAVEGGDVMSATACDREPPHWRDRVMAELELDRPTEEALPVGCTAA